MDYPKEILEQNRMIALFMGWKPKESGYYPISQPEYNEYGNQTPESNGTYQGDKPIYMYHQSWDWLMPVIIKIQKGHEPISVNIYNEATEIKLWGEGGYHEYNHITHNLTSKIQHVYEAVVHYLNWYNEQKTKKG